MNPIFQLGRVIQAGDGDPELRVVYSDDTAPERSVFEVDRKGIAASVRETRGSHFEGFVRPLGDNNAREPVFRLNSFPNIRLEMGEGGLSPVDVVLERTAARTVTIQSGGSAPVQVNVAGDIHPSGYTQLGTSAGVPPAADCSSASHVGRMKVDAAAAMVYVCMASGWGRLQVKK